MMGRPDKPSASDEEAQRNASCPVATAANGGETAASATALGNLHAAAAVEAFFRSSQGIAAAAAASTSGSVTSDTSSQLFLGAGFDPLQAIARNPSILQRMAKSVQLPLSAPVSSLLPPLPIADGLTTQGLLALQTHLAGMSGPGSLLGAGVGASLAPSLHSASDVSAVQQLFAAQALPKAPISASVTPHMQSWSLEQLEQHVSLLNQLKQAVPESVAVFLADARRRDAKKTAKRLANRKSASSSRARKKALVQEMTELNARLKRQAQILALLPDLVITINLEGVVTFCSAQVERVLHHGIDDIVGAKLEDLLVSASKGKLNRLIAQLVASEQMATLGAAAGMAANVTDNNADDTAMGNESNVGGSSRANSGPENASEVAVVSEPSFPLSVVKVKAKDGSSDDNENSDNSTSLPGSKDPSSLTRASGTSIPRSPTASSLGISGSDDAQKGKNGKKNPPRSDISNSSSLSTTAKKLQRANENLEKNVRAHNKKMKKKGSASYKDDVTGADVTANNASARLSSLQHRLESSSEEDSGYRESNDSREETSSSASDSSSSNGRRKPLAPTCTVCLVRKDLTTIWCEVTSSIRTVENLGDGMNFEFGSDDGKSRKSGAKAGMKSEEGSAPSELEMPAEKELLLCLRPIRDGEAKMDEKLRFGSRKLKAVPKQVAGSPNAKPSKKRRPDSDGLEGEPVTKKVSVQSNEKGGVDNDIVESLMAMNKRQGEGKE